MSHLDPVPTPAARGLQFSLRETIGVVTIAVLAMALGAMILRFRAAESELFKLRGEVGYLSPTPPELLAAVRVPTDEALTYRVRVRVPDNDLPYRFAYSSMWPAGSAGPAWFGAVPLTPGESVVTVTVAADPRDGRWKVSTRVGTLASTRRMATALPPEQSNIFRGSHEVLSTGIRRGQTVAVPPETSIRVLDERWLVGEGSLLLYGDRAPESDQIGIYAEVQPDTGPL